MKSKPALSPLLSSPIASPSLCAETRAKGTGGWETKRGRAQPAGTEGWRDGGRAPRTCPEGLGHQPGQIAGDFGPGEVVVIEGLDGWNNERPPPVPGVCSIPHLHALGAPARPSHGAVGRGVGAGGWGSGSGSRPGSGPLRASAPRARPGMRRRRVRPSREPPASARAGASPLSRRGRARARRGRPQRSRRGGRPAIAPPAAPPSARGPALGAPAGRSAGPLGLAGDAAGGLGRPPPGAAGAASENVKVPAARAPTAVPPGARSPPPPRCRTAPSALRTPSARRSGPARPALPRASPAAARAVAASAAAAAVFQLPHWTERRRGSAHASSRGPPRPPPRGGPGGPRSMRGGGGGSAGQPSAHPGVLARRAAAADPAGEAGREGETGLAVAFVFSRRSAEAQGTDVYYNAYLVAHTLLPTCA